MITEPKDNEYEKYIIEFLDTSILKDWFRPRHGECVFTQVKVGQEAITITADPDPFLKGCINDMEWALLAALPVLSIGVISLVFLFRKVIESQIT
jgi:hypothetical protein